MINHGEFKSVRSTTNHPETTDQAQQIDVGGGQQNGTSTPEAAFGDTKSSAGDAGTPPEAVTALQELLAKVEAGDGHDPSDYLCLMIVDNSITARNAYNGSLDAAKALHEAVLPEWRVTHAFGLVAGEMAKFNLTQNDNLTQNEKPLTYVGGKSATPARAWLIAVIKALIAQEQTT
jgi:hypothetical protein